MTLLHHIPILVFSKKKQNNWGKLNTRFPANFPAAILIRLLHPWEIWLVPFRILTLLYEPTKDWIILCCCIGKCIRIMSLNTYNKNVYIANFPAAILIRLLHPWEIWLVPFRIYHICKVKHILSKYIIH
jgi:hypothetical protein